MDVFELTLKLAAGALPKLTARAPLRLLPEMVTGVPAGPNMGARVVTLGPT